MKSTSTNPGGDIQAIRDIMERSSKFLSLSGLAGIFAGICALTGALAAWIFIFGPVQVSFGEYILQKNSPASDRTGLYLALAAMAVLISAMTGAVYFSQRKARRSSQKFWTNTTRRLLIHLLIPLVTGGLLILILAYRGNPELIIPAMLIFYGLALVNAGKFTFGEIHYLGLTQIALGLLAALFVKQGLLLWTVGFGLMHIIYGSVMYYRHER